MIETSGHIQALGLHTLQKLIKTVGVRFRKKQSAKAIHASKNIIPDNWAPNTFLFQVTSLLHKIK